MHVTRASWVLGLRHSHRNSRWRHRVSLAFPVLAGRGGRWGRARSAGHQAEPRVAGAPRRPRILPPCARACVREPTSTRRSSPYPPRPDAHCPWARGALRGSGPSCGPSIASLRPASLFSLSPCSWRSQRRYPTYRAATTKVRRLAEPGSVRSPQPRPRCEHPCLPSGTMDP